ncbi:MAG: ferrous iron transport protein B [Bacteroidetes bacterium]|nr:ferrous iron transport protein B [Bacteroidota bacterium]
MRVALAGNPNAGKSSVFNRLTGLQQQVGNFPGVTVEKKTGPVRLPAGQKAQLTDLPGVYSLYPHSPDQVITLQVLINKKDVLHPDVVLYVADASNLERHLLLFTEIADLGLPIILCLNQMDVARERGISIDIPMLAKGLGVPVFPINGRTGEGLKQVLASLEHPVPLRGDPFWKPEKANPQVVSAVQKVLPDLGAYQAILVAHQNRHLAHLQQQEREAIQEALDPIGFLSLRAQVSETMSRFDGLTPIVQQAVSSLDRAARSRTALLDRVLIHPLYGTITFFIVLFMIFQAVFRWAEWPMKLMDQGIAGSRNALEGLLPESLLSDLLINGLIPGIGGILIFIPQIALLFALVALLEEVGYMARAVYLSDNVMRRFGLNGRSFVALISGIACAVPAIMTARGITNRQERLATIFVTPFMSCSARLPVYALLIAFAVPASSTLGGWLNLQGLVMFGLYFLGAFSALATSWLIKRFFPSAEPSYLMLELPDYRKPHWRNVLTTVWQKVSVFVSNAGRIILVISLILWVLSSYGPGTGVRDAASEVTANYAYSALSSNELEGLIAARQLEMSWAGHLGHLLEPIIAPLGFDWKIGIALITSFAAREVFVSTMATIYGAADQENKTGIVESMRLDVHPATGLPVYTAATAVSLLLFYVFAMQCMSTLAVVQRETGSWKIPIYQFLYMTGIAYGASFLAYQVLS